MRQLQTRGPYWGPLSTPWPYVARREVAEVDPTTIEGPDDDADDAPITVGQVRLGDNWPYTSRLATAVHYPPGRAPAFASRAYAWDVAFFGPVHQLMGVTWKLSSEVTTPTLGDIVQVYVSAGSNTAYLLNGSGTVYGFGSGFGGALGQGDEADHFGMPPVAIDCGGQPVRRLMGGSGDTFSMFAVTWNAELWGWGLDELLLQHPGEQMSAVRVLPSQLPAGSVLDVTVAAENVVFVRRKRIAAGSGQRAWTEIVG